LEGFLVWTLEEYRYEEKDQLENDGRTPG